MTTTVRPAQRHQAYGYAEDHTGVSKVLHSAEVIVPLLQRHLPLRRVVDLGCGTGDWLSVFRAHGATDIYGFDGKWVPQGSLCIPREHFHVVDFYEDALPLPPADLAVCLEVLEHVALPVAEKMLDALANSADVVLFSAAQPGQGGYEHINEQWQSFWIERWAARGFVAGDLLRPSIWMNERVSWWYQQNLLVFARPAAWQKAGLVPPPVMADLVHPVAYNYHRDPRHYSLKEVVRHLPTYLSDRLRRS